MTLRNERGIVQRVAVIFDTNSIFKYDNTKNLEASAMLDAVLSHRKRVGFAIYDIYFPKMVISEIVVQKKEEMVEVKDKMTKACSYFKVIPPQITENIKEELDMYLKAHNIHLLENTKNLAKIAARALKKVPPFREHGGGSDVGFKDAVIWESILENNFARARIGKVLFVTQDNDFLNKKEELKKEFETKQQVCTIEFFKNEAALLSELDNLLTEVIAHCNIQYQEVEDVLKQKYPDTVKILSYKEEIMKTSSDIVKVKASMERADGSRFTGEYFFDIDTKSAMPEYIEEEK